jgi:hypothetical protein
MKRIEIVEQVDSDVYYMDKDEFIKKLKDRKEQIQLLSRYDISDDSIIHYIDYIYKDILLECRNLSFNLLNTLLYNKFLSNEDLKDLSTSTYSNLSEEFCIKNLNDLDLEKLLLSYSIKNDIIPKYLIDNIDDNESLNDSIFRILSNTKLEETFIEKYKNKLYFDSLFLNNDMSNFNREDFILLKNSDSVENRNYLNNNLNFSDTSRLIRRCVNLDELTK